VIGTYPLGGKLDVCRGSKTEHAKALASIPQLPLFASEPVFGPNGQLIALWHT
jgi:uncharacterized protein YjlB